MVVSQEHVVLWDTIGRYLLEPPSLYFSEKRDKPFPLDDVPLRNLFVTTIKTGMREWELRQGRPISTWSWFQMPVGSPVICAEPVAYLVYPLLEAVLKRRLSDHLSREGIVTKAFSVPKRRYAVGNRCSKLDHMLALLGQNESSSILGGDLKQVLDHISFLYPGSEPLSVIAHEWRNPAMHGQHAVSTAYGIVLNIVLLVAMADVKDELITRLGP